MRSDQAAQLPVVYAEDLDLGPEVRLATLLARRGRPQGLAFAPDGTLHVVDALVGASGVYRFTSEDRPPEIVVSGSALVGVAFGPNGEMVVASNESVYRFDATN